MRHFNIKNGLFVALLASATLAGCKKDDYAPVGESYAITSESLVGSWKLTSVTEIDEAAVYLGYPTAVQSEDITDAYPFDTYEIAFAANEDKVSGSYTVANTNDAPVFLSGSGNWKFYDPNGPRQLKMVATGSQDTVFVDFPSAYLKSQNKLALSFSRKGTDGKAYLTYKYIFSRK